MLINIEYGYRVFHVSFFFNAFSIQYLTRKRDNRNCFLQNTTDNNTSVRWKKNYKNKQKIKVIDGDIHLNHNDNVTHDFPLYQPKIKQ